MCMGQISVLQLMISQVNNTIVLWDRIVRRPEDAKVNVVGARNKYAFKEVGGKGFGKGQVQ